MGKDKADVERARGSAHRVERFDVARLLAIADEYANDRPRENEFATTWFAKAKGWTYERAMKTLRRMESDGVVTSRRAGHITLWRMSEGE